MARSDDSDPATVLSPEAPIMFHAGPLVTIRSQFGREDDLGIETRVKPIHPLKAHRAGVIRELGDGGPPMVITKMARPRRSSRDAARYAATQALLALLKLLAIGLARHRRGPDAAARSFEGPHSHARGRTRCSAYR